MNNDESSGDEDDVRRSSSPARQPRKPHQAAVRPQKTEKKSKGKERAIVKSNKGKDKTSNKRRTRKASRERRARDLDSEDSDSDSEDSDSDDSDSDDSTVSSVVRRTNNKKKSHHSHKDRNRSRSSRANRPSVRQQTAPSSDENDEELAGKGRRHQMEDASPSVAQYDSDSTLLSEDDGESDTVEDTSSDEQDPFKWVLPVFEPPLEDSYARFAGLKRQSLKRTIIATTARAIAKIAARDGVRRPAKLLKVCPCLLAVFTLINAMCRRFEIGTATLKSLVKTHQVENQVPGPDNRTHTRRGRQ